MFDFEFLREHWVFIAAGLGVTLGLAVFSFLLAAPLAILVAKGRRSALLPVKALCTFYVWLIDGIPFLLQIFFIFLVLPSLTGISLPGLWSGVLVLTVHYGSRMSKIFYERFAATGNNLRESRTSLIRSLTDEFTGMIKDSTLISLTGFVQDVYWRATRVGRAEFRNLEALIVATVIYLTLITLISFGSKALRRTMTTSDPGTEVPA